MRYRRSKKADLSLSINSIVILVLAITMLALGLSFIKGLFPKIASQVQAKISEEGDPKSPTDANPISLSRDNVVANKNEDVVLKIAVYCKKPGSAADPGCSVPALTLTCLSIGAGIDTALETNSYKAPVYDRIPYLSSKTGIALFKTTDKVGTTVCSVAAANDILETGKSHFSQFVLTIR